MEIEKPPRRRRNHKEDFKQAVIAACSEPGASVAGIALANGVNANLVRRWLRDRGVELPKLRQLERATGAMVEVPSGFIPVPMVPTAPEPPPIRIEVRRGNTGIKIDWPVSAAGDCANWLRDWLR